MAINIVAARINADGTPAVNDSPPNVSYTQGISSVSLVDKKRALYKITFTPNTFSGGPVVLVTVNSPDWPLSSTVTKDTPWNHVNVIEANVDYAIVMTLHDSHGPTQMNFNFVAIGPTHKPINQNLTIAYGLVNTGYSDKFYANFKEHTTSTNCQPPSVISDGLTLLGFAPKTFNNTDFPPAIVLCSYYNNTFSETYNSVQVGVSNDSCKVTTGVHFDTNFFFLAVSCGGDDQSTTNNISNVGAYGLFLGFEDPGVSQPATVLFSSNVEKVQPVPTNYPTYGLTQFGLPNSMWAGKPIILTSGSQTDQPEVLKGYFSSVAHWDPSDSTGGYIVNAGNNPPPIPGVPFGAYALVMGKVNES